jgi:putative lipoprotein
MVIVAGALRMPPSGGMYERVRVSVRDVTEFDGPARTVALQELSRVVVPDAGLELPFTLDAELEPGHRYVIRAHADRNGTGAVETGDLVSTTAHEVGPAGRTGVVVTLQPVGGAAAPPG